MPVTRDWQHRPQEPETIDDVIGDVLLRVTRIQEIEEIEPEETAPCQSVENRDCAEACDRAEHSLHPEFRYREDAHDHAQIDAHDPRHNPLEDFIVMTADEVLGDTRVQDAISPLEHKPGEKSCNACGKNVAGKLRYKDHHGYWCVDCHRADARKRHHVPRVKCDGCRKRVPESAAQREGDAGVLCTRCHANRQVQRERQEKNLAQAAKRERSRRMVYMQLSILAVVGIFATICYQAGLFSWNTHAPRRGANDARDLMDGARVMGLTFVALLGGFAWWMKRQV